MLGLWSNIIPLRILSASPSLTRWSTKLLLGVGLMCSVDVYISDLGEVKFTPIHVALHHHIHKGIATSSVLHGCCTLTSTTDFCLLGKTHSQLFYSSSQGIQ